MYLTNLKKNNSPTTLSGNQNFQKSVLTMFYGFDLVLTILPNKCQCTIYQLGRGGVLGQVKGCGSRVK